MVNTNDKLKMAVNVQKIESCDLSRHTELIHLTRVLFWGGGGGGGGGGGIRLDFFI